ncbi:Protein GLY-15 a [Aphelenchoides avenae]|nr:Protein GLY-15 a [Aphelenchus avenae]
MTFLLTWADATLKKLQYQSREVSATSFDRPLYDEERLFPIAYGLLVHPEKTQVYFLLSAIYQPQNAYCIAVDGKSSEALKRRMSLLAGCFPNIDVLFVDEVRWASYEIVRGVFDCLRHLTALDHPWRYYQLVSSLVPSCLSELFSREAANVMVHSEKVRDHLEFIKRLDVPDEKLWGSILGTPKELTIPGSFDAQALYTNVVAAGGNSMPGAALEFMPPPLQEPCALPYYFIGWYQTWAHTGPCHGRYTSGSCVFGVGDLPALYRRGELMAHKIYLKNEPAAFFCLYERVRLRALDSRQQRFRGSAYARLPPVQLHNGVPLNDVHNVSC